MWNIKLTGHDPTNPAICKVLQIRGNTIRTLSDRVRAEARWRGSAMVTRVSDTVVEVRPSKTYGECGMAICTFTPNKDRPPSDDEIVAAYLATVPDHLFLAEVRRRREHIINKEQPCDPTPNQP